MTNYYRTDTKMLLNPFTPKIDQFQISPAASPEIIHHTLWRSWLFIGYPDERWLYYQSSLPHLYISLKMYFLNLGVHQLSLTMTSLPHSQTLSILGSGNRQNEWARRLSPFFGALLYRGTLFTKRDLQHRRVDNSWIQGHTDHGRRQLECQCFWHSLDGPLGGAVWGNLSRCGLVDQTSWP